MIAPLAKVARNSVGIRYGRGRPIRDCAILGEKLLLDTSAFQIQLTEIRFLQKDGPMPKIWISVQFNFRSIIKWFNSTKRRGGQMSLERLTSHELSDGYRCADPTPGNRRESL